MGRGLGVLQRRILAALAVTTNEPPALTTRELATLLDRSQRRIRAAIYSLEHHGLIRVENRSLAGRLTYGLLVWDPERADAWDKEELDRLIRDDKGEDPWEWEDDAWRWWPLPWLPRMGLDGEIWC